MRTTASLAMVALTLATTQLAHAAGSVVQAHAQLTNITIQLEDLTPNDGVGGVYGGPTNQWSHEASASYGVQGLSPSGNQIVTKELEFARMSNFKSAYVNAALLSGEASATGGTDGPDIEQASVNLGKDRFEEGFTYGELNGERYGGAILNAHTSITNHARLLGAGTGFTFTATFTLSVSVDASELVGLTQGENLRVLGSADFSMGMLPSFTSTIPGLEFDQAQIHQSLSFQQDVGPQGLVSGNGASSAQQTFTLTGSVRNFSKQDVWLIENWQVNALARVTPVPEPSTWALLVAGLGLVPFIRRRQAA